MTTLDRLLQIRRTRLYELEQQARFTNAVRDDLVYARRLYMLAERRAARTREQKR